LMLGPQVSYGVQADFLKRHRVLGTLEEFESSLRILPEVPCAELVTAASSKSGGLTWEMCAWERSIKSKSNPRCPRRISHTGAGHREGDPERSATRQNFHKGVRPVSQTAGPPL